MGFIGGKKKKSVSPIVFLSPRTIAAPQPQIFLLQWWGKRRGSCAARHGRAIIQFIDHIKFFPTLWAFSPYIFHRHWGLADSGRRCHAVFRFWAAGLFLCVHLHIFTSFLNVHIGVYTTFHVFLSRFFIGMCGNKLLAILYGTGVCILNHGITTTFGAIKYGSYCLDHLFLPPPP